MYERDENDSAETLNSSDNNRATDRVDPVDLVMAGRTNRSADTLSLTTALSQARDPVEAGRLRAEIVLCNRPVAEAIAARYRGRGVAAEDLRQVAYEGLVKAVERFEPTRGHDLLTFAVPTIRGELQRYFRDTGWTVRPPRRIQEPQWRINQHTSSLYQQLHREPTWAELSAALGVSTADLAEAHAARGAFHPSSLDRPVDTGSQTTLGDLIPTPQDHLGAAESRHLLRQALRVLTERVRRIVELRFWEDKLQREIATDLGMTQMQVSRLLTSIHAKLRQALAEDSDGDPDPGPSAAPVASA